MLLNRVLLFNILNIADILTTIVGISLSGGHEANPLMALLIDSWGYPGFVAVKLFIGALTSIILYRRKRENVLNFAIILLTLVVLNNSIQILVAQ